MNLAWHHFKKEARHLYLRWLVWLILVALDLLVQLELALPMQDYEYSLPVPYLLHQAVFWLALVLALSGCPEDRPANDNGFLATRPLPRFSYYAARILTVVILLVGPLVLQEVLYLALSSRPVDQVLAGAAWRAIQGGAWLLWTVPATALWRGWLPAALGAVMTIAAVFACSYVAQIHFPKTSWAQDVSSLLPAVHWAAGWLAALFAVTLAWLYRSRPGKAVGMQVAAACTGIAIYFFMLTAEKVGRDLKTATYRPQVAEWEKIAEAGFPAPKLRPLLHSLYQERPARGLYGEFESPGLPPSAELRPVLRSVSARVDGKKVSGHLTQDDDSPRSSMPYAGPRIMPGPMLSLLPAGSLLVPPPSEVYRSGSSPLELDLGRTELGNTANGRELVWESDFKMHWLQWTLEGELPLKAGSVLRLDDAEITLAEPLPHTYGWGHTEKGKQLGALTLPLQFKQTETEAGLWPVLYSPNRKLAWCLDELKIGEPGRTIAARATDTEWKRGLAALSLDGVLLYPDGEKADNVADLKLLIFRRRQLGTTAWQWESGAMNLQRPVPGHRNWFFRLGSTPLADRAEALKRRLAVLQPPDPGASRAEMNLYVLQVLRAFHGLESESKEVRSAQYDLVVAKLKPFAKQHPEVILELPNSAVAGPRSPAFRVAEQVATESKREYVITHMLEADWLAALARSKGWSQAAHHTMLPAVLAVPRHEKHLRTLMLGWEDERVQQRQISELTFFPDPQAFETLYARPPLRPALDKLALQQKAKILPVAGWEGYSMPALETALAQGDREALALALRWVGNGQQTSAHYDLGQLRQMIAMVARLTGHGPPPQDIEKAAAGFRHLRAEQFEYVAGQRSWRKKS